MKKIQIVTYNQKDLSGYSNNAVISNFNNLKALDDYDINIFNLNCSEIWCNATTDSNSPTLEMKLTSDFNSIKTMIANSNKAINVICLPQNLYYTWKYYNEYSRKQLKDMIPIFLLQLRH